MGNSFRQQPSPTLYEEFKSPVTSDLLQVGILVAFGMIAFSFCLILPGIRGIERLWAMLRVSYALFVGVIILTCNFGSWYSDKICTRTQHKANTARNIPQIIEAEVGLSIGLRGINITLLEKQCNEFYESPFPQETINYNERFMWSDPWGQGRRDFGIHGGRFNQEYRAAKYRGTPYAIMWVAELFTIDGEQILWYRKFRIAGWYTHIALWTAFATYLLTIILFVYNINRGVMFMVITGLLMMLASVTYAISIINDPHLEIHFQDDTIRPKFNYCFYFSLITGFLTVLLALTILLINYLWPRTAAAIFHHSVIEDDTLFEILDDAEVTGLVRKRTKSSHRQSRNSYESPGSLRRVLHRSGARKYNQNSVMNRNNSGVPQDQLESRRKSAPVTMSPLDSQHCTVTVPLQEITIHGCD